MRRRIEDTSKRDAGALGTRRRSRLAAAAAAAVLGFAVQAAHPAAGAARAGDTAEAGSPTGISAGPGSTRGPSSLSLLAPEPGAPAGAAWLARAQQELAAREYRATQTARGLQAPNRRHNLRSYFEPAGVRVVDRTAAGSPELVALRAAALGRGSALSELTPGVVTSAGARVEIRRAGLVEWFENSAAGLEQGFDLAERPDGSGELFVDLAISGARARLRSDHVALRTVSGRRLRYGNLAATDAAGRTLPARFELPSPQRLRLAIDDGTAQYPIRIDPLLSASPDSQLESDQAASLFGHSVAGAGDVDGDGHADVIVGAYGYDAGETNEGAAFVFRGSATGIPDAAAAAAATQLEGNQSGAAFGYSVAGAGDVDGDGYADVIVGAYLYDSGSQNEGAAFVFHGSPTGIDDASPATAATQLESDQADAFFGFRVAGAGDVDGDGRGDVIVGSVLYDGGLADEGAAFVFRGSATGIDYATPATAATRIESNQANAQLGHAVAGARDVNGDGYADVIVTAILYDDGESDEGAAFVFHGSASGIAHGDPGSAAATLQSNQAVAGMGYSIAGAGDVDGDGYADVIASATGYSNGEAGEGAAWIFHGSASGVGNRTPASADAQLESDQAGANFGQSVASAGDVNGDGYADVIVGAVLYDAGESDEGAAFVFLGGAGGVGDGNPTTAYATLESDQAGALLGRSVAGVGDVNGDGHADVAAGAPSFTSGESLEGAAFVFLGGARGIRDGDPAAAAAQLEGDAPALALGEDVASAGDVNADGYSDLLVGAPSFDGGEVDEGAAFLFYGSASGIASDAAAGAAAQFESNQAGAAFGRSVAAAGDVDADGHADILIGADAYDAGESNEGAAFVFLGSASGIADGSPATAAAQLESNQALAAFGRSVAGAGDVNGDGHADLVIGAPDYDAGSPNEGAAFVFHGSASGVVGRNPANAAARIESDQPAASLGESVASVGDIDGDGYADIALGADEYDAPESAEGAVFVFRGSAGGVRGRTPATAHARLESDQANALFGGRVGAAGDVDGDGYADLLVGAVGYDEGVVNGGGAAFLFLGSATGVPSGGVSGAATELFSDQPGAGVGSDVATAGDLDGDGHADLAVGASCFDSGESDEGAVFVYFGSATGIATGNVASAPVRLESNQPSASFGASAASAGDVNGDGFADLVVGSPLYAAGESGEGAALLFLGGDGLGRSARPAQLRGDGSGVAVQPWGHSNDADAFAVELSATPWEGRALAKLEIEACLAGAAFGSPACAHRFGATWSAVPLGSQGLRLSETISGLPPALRYRWRARVLYAPLSATQPGVVPPPAPAHGPWRRLQAQSVEADLRVVPEPSALAALAAGGALLGALVRRRRASIR
jgi:hypothetical protein